MTFEKKECWFSHVATPKHIVNSECDFSYCHSFLLLLIVELIFHATMHFMWLN